MQGAAGSTSVVARDLLMCSSTATSNMQELHELRPVPVLGPHCLRTRSTDCSWPPGRRQMAKLVFGCFGRERACAGPPGRYLCDELSLLASHALRSNITLTAAKAS